MIENHNQYVTGFLKVMAGLFIGGTFGNLVDRVFNGGAVRDFLLVEFWNNTSNLADLGITVGCVLIAVWFVFFYGRKNIEEGRRNTEEK